MRLSKSKVTVGLQCHRRLWWTVHNRDAPELEPDASLQAIFDRGSRVGELATKDHPGGVLVDMGALGGPDGSVRRTAELLDQGVDTIFEASFRAHDVFVAVDILYREGRGWVLAEVKSTLSAKPQHIQDAAVQTWVARASGVDVVRVEIVHLNPDHRFPDREPLFARTDVTDEAEAFLLLLPGEVAAQQTALAGVLPTVEPGPQCKSPYECPFQSRCWPRRPMHHVSELYRAHAKAVAELEAAGTPSIYQLPADLHLAGPAARQRDAVQRGELLMEPSLAEALAPIEGPVSYLDFETIMPAVPVWHGCAPYEQVPVQYSLHVDRGGAVVHHAWLAQAGEDPRPALAASLVEHVPASGSILAYNASFEGACLARLADAVPKHADALLAMKSRLFDLLPVVRDHVYHPDFRGSFSLKKVAPALCGGGYGDLEVADGQLAARTLEALLLRPDEVQDDEAELRKQLLAYCERDTEVLVALHRRLANLGTQQTSSDTDAYLFLGYYIGLCGG